MKEEIIYIQKDHETDVTNQTDIIQCLEQDLKRCKIQLENMELEREKTHMGFKDMKM
jgi:hypothetical protein